MHHVAGVRTRRVRLTAGFVVLMCAFSQALAGANEGPEDEVPDLGWLDNAGGEPLGILDGLEDSVNGGSGLHCDVDAQRPYYENFKAVAYGEGSCDFPPYISRDEREITITVKLSRKLPSGAWDPMKVRNKGPFHWQAISKTVRDWCTPGETDTYQTKAWVGGSFTDEQTFAWGATETPPDKATREFFCPINLSAPDVTWMVDDEAEDVGEETEGHLEG